MVQLIFIGMLPIVLSGCLAAAIGAGVGAVKYGSSKQKKVYQEYVVAMEQLNLEREKSGLEVRPILSYEEWKKGKDSEEKTKYKHQMD